MPIDPISFDMAQFYWYLDATRAETELGWRARDPIETLHDTVRDLRDRGIVWPEPEGAGHRALG
jgi:dihydroflavonol-4-reductase